MLEQANPMARKRIVPSSAIAVDAEMLQGLRMEMNPAQCRAARGLLDWHQPKLAEEAGVSISSVVDFEKSRRKLSPEMIQAIRLALEHAGVMFLPDSGLKLRRVGRKGKRRQAGEEGV